MAYDPGMADQMRADIGLRDGISEKKMFGGLCFLLDGNMISGVHKGGAMVRIGKPAEAEALALAGVAPLSFTGRKMGGMVEMDADAFEDASVREAVTAMALAYAASLPAKGAT